MALAIPLTINRRQQAGAFTILSAFTLLVLLMFLALVLDSGRLYMEQRKLQKVADTSALGALLLLPDGNCSTDRNETLRHATANAAANDFTHTLDLQCADIEDVGGLRIAVANNTSGRAVEVTVSHEVPSSLIMQVGSLFNSNTPDKITLQAKAVAARDEPVAVFSVGSQLLNVSNNKLLGRLLSTVGLDPNILTVLDQHGVANVHITPSGLLAALGVGADLDLRTLTADGVADAVLNTDLLGLNLVDAAIKVIEDSTITVIPELLDSLKLLGDQPLIDDLDLNLLLFGTPDSRGILSLTTAKPDDPVGAALDTAVNLGDLLSTTILIGAHDRALSIGSPHDPEDSALQLLRTVEVELGIVEPPSIGIGPKGTTAYNAQVRLKVDINTSAGPLGGLLELLGTRIHLPIIIDLANASGKLTALNCEGPAPSATIDVISALGAVCVGHMPDAMWSTKKSCNEVVEDQSLVKVLGLLDIKGKLNLRVLETDGESLTFSQEELLRRQAETPVSSYTLPTREPNPLHLGTLLTDLVDGVMGLLQGAELPSTLDASQAQQVAKHYLKDSPGEYGYTKSELKDIKAQLRTTQIDWPTGNIFDSDLYKMTSRWLNDLHLHDAPERVLSCPKQNNHYKSSCVESTLVNALQLDATEPLFGRAVGSVAALLQALLSPILEHIVKPVLNLVGEHILSPLLEDLLDLEFNRTYVTLHDISCGAPRLVR